MQQSAVKSNWSPSIPCKNHKINLDTENIKVDDPNCYKIISSSIGNYHYSKDTNKPIFSQVLFTEKKNNKNRQIPFSIKAPARVDLELTYKCNLKCRHCYVLDKTPHDFDFKQIEKLFNQFAKMGVIGVQLIGGEPSLYPRIDKVLEIASRLKLKIEIVSNGNPVLIKKCLNKSNLINILFISIDGLENTHDYLRRCKGSFRSAIRSINLFSNKKTTTKVICTLNNKNKNEINQIIKETKLAGANNLIFKFMLPVGKDRDKFSLVIPENERKKIRQKIIEIKDDYIQDQMYPVFNDVGLFSFFGCPAGRFSIRISPYGTVHWCVYGGDQLGNIYQTSFSDIWSDIQTKNFIGDPHCPYHLRCGGPCRLSEKYNNGFFKCQRVN